MASTDWCSEIGSLTSLDACNSGASSEPISLHQAVLALIKIFANLKNLEISHNAQEITLCNRHHHFAHWADKLKCSYREHQNTPSISPGDCAMPSERRTLLTQITNSWHLPDFAILTTGRIFKKIEQSEPY